MVAFWRLGFLNKFSFVLVLIFFVVVIIELIAELPPETVVDIEAVEFGDVFAGLFVAAEDEDGVFVEGAAVAGAGRGVLALGVDAGPDERLEVQEVDLVEVHVLRGDAAHDRHLRPDHARAVIRPRLRLRPRRLQFFVADLRYVELEHLVRVVRLLPADEPPEQVDPRLVNHRRVRIDRQVVLRPFYWGLLAVHLYPFHVF